MKNVMKIGVFLMLAIGMTTAQAQSKQVNVSSSTIKWEGKKVSGAHSGTIDLKKGTLVVKNDRIKGGKFVVDMTSINTTDLDGGGKTKLDGHLKNDDFFGVDKHPTATLSFKKIARYKEAGKYKITADLTIKGITESVVFDLIAKDGKGSANVMIDRTKYGIKYGSGSFFSDLGDKTINDEFSLHIEFAY